MRVGRLESALSIAANKHEHAIVGMGAKGRPIMTAKISGITPLRFIVGVAGLMLAVALPLSALNAQAPATKQDTTAAKKKIYYGDAAKKGAYPFMVSIFKASAKQSEAGIHGAHFCGGSLIRQRWVLTAAHCMYELDQQPPRARKPEDINVYVGSNEFKGGQRIKVRRIIVHPKYEVEENPDNDIALLELAEAPAPGRTSIITLATPATEQDFGVPGKAVTAAGWGENEEGEFPKALMEVKLDIVDAGTCNSNILSWRRNQWFENNVAGLRAKLSLSEETVNQMRKLLDSSPQERVITDNMICTAKFATRKDTCVGDSGGPLFAEVSRGRFVQVGLTSFSEAGCGMAEQGLFGVYTRVAQYIDWIEQTAEVAVGSDRVFLGQRQPELLFFLDEAGQLGVVERLELGAGFLKPLLQLGIVENFPQAVVQDTHDRLRRPASAR